MKVILLNGSPHENGTTAYALSVVEKELNAEGIETERINLGAKRYAGCNACMGCLGKNRCVVDDVANEIIKKVDGADGFIVGTPVYYASVNGTLKAVLDRVFFAKKSFAGKVASAVAVARRAGTTATIDVIDKYFEFAGMPVVPSCYWNNVFGGNAEEGAFDKEGEQTMRTLAKNTAWLLKCIDAGKKVGIEFPTPEQKIKTNFYKG